MEVMTATTSYSGRVSRVVRSARTAADSSPTSTTLNLDCWVISEPVPGGGPLPVPHHLGEPGDGEDRVQLQVFHREAQFETLFQMKNELDQSHRVEDAGLKQVGVDGVDPDGHLFEEQRP